MQTPFFTLEPGYGVVIKEREGAKRVRVFFNVRRVVSEDRTFTLFFVNGDQWTCLQSVYRMTSIKRQACAES